MTRTRAMFSCCQALVSGTEAMQAIFACLHARKPQQKQESEQGLINAPQYFSAGIFKVWEAFIIAVILICSCTHRTGTGATQSSSASTPQIKVAEILKVSHVILGLALVLVLVHPLAPVHLDVWNLVGGLEQPGPKSFSTLLLCHLEQDSPVADTDLAVPRLDLPIEFQAQLVVVKVVAGSMRLCLPSIVNGAMTICAIPSACCWAYSYVRAVESVDQDGLPWLSTLTFGLFASCRSMVRIKWSSL